MIARLHNGSQAWIYQHPLTPMHGMIQAQEKCGCLEDVAYHMSLANLFSYDARQVYLMIWRSIPCLNTLACGI